ncbi:MAG: hypothetical protein KGL93_01415 [Gemmatimonadota bacterium]|nr:hypothetical protein [Gemmatimonadota bacterium]
MYSTCLFCNAKLGANDVIEHFPVGRRLAFDAEKGRLWVVCRKCERWNLSPVEERWEAIEECERVFRDTRLRVSTDNIGLARVREGLELVRIGRAQRPEMAAWRYGDQFGRRRRRYYTYAGVGVAALAGVYIVGPALGLYAVGGAGFLGQAPNIFAQVYRRSFGGLKLPVAWQEKPIKLEAEHLAKVNLVPDDTELGWALRVPLPRSQKKLVLPEGPRHIGEAPLPRLEYIGKRPQLVFSGSDAIRVAGRVLPKINMSGAGKDDVQRAVSMIQDDGDPARFFARHAQPVSDPKGRIIKQIPKPIRLALEMSAHEDAERRALEGELAMLEAAWKEADEIAAISDNLLLPAEVDRWFARLKRG